MNPSIHTSLPSRDGWMLLRAIKTEFNVGFLPSLDRTDRPPPRDMVRHETHRIAWLSISRERGKANIPQSVKS